MDEQRRLTEAQRQALEQQQGERRREWERQRGDGQRRSAEQQRQSQLNQNRQRNDQNQQRQWSAQQRNDWRRREEQSWRQRQNQFRAQHLARERQWREQERRLQQQRRMNQWRIQQRYWERLRQDQVRLQSFVYTDYGVPNYRYSRNGSSYDVNQNGADLLRRAVDAGYEEGFRAGQADRQDGWQFDPENCDAFVDASYGYDGYYVDVAEYQHYFREGFLRGYEDGYHGRSQYGTNSNGKLAILGEILNVILNLTRF
jgi:hypothetical protein